MTPTEFLKLGYTSWFEIHWTLARTDDQVKLLMKRLEIDGQAHRIQYSTQQKNSDGFFAWWIGVSK